VTETGAGRRAKRRGPESLYLAGCAPATSGAARKTHARPKELPRRVYDSITWSPAGGVTADRQPSALAVLRLMTSSKSLGCSMGKSAGRRPEELVHERGRMPPQPREAGPVGHEAATMA